MLFPLYDLNPHRRFPWFTLILIGVNFAITASMSGLNQRETNALAMRYGFVPARLSHMGQGQIIKAEVKAIDPRTGQEMRDVVELSTKPEDVYTTLFTTIFLHGGWL